jgi:hypothetical protein
MNNDYDPTDMLKLEEEEREDEAEKNKIKVRRIINCDTGDEFEVLFNIAEDQARGL